MVCLQPKVTFASNGIKFTTHQATMTSMTFFAQLVSHPKRWIAQQTGNIAMVTALTIAGVVLAVGVAVDMARTGATQTALAAAVDAAVLQAAAAGSTDQATIEDRATHSLELNYDDTKFGEIIESSIAATDDDITLSATARYETSFLSLFGIDHVNIPVSSTATQGGMNLEVALVLDLTGSMSSASVASLQAAAKSLASTVIQGDQSYYSTRVAVIPYSIGVNLGSRASDARGVITEGTCTTPGCEYYSYNSEANTSAVDTCVTERTGDYAYTDDSVALAPVGLHYATSMDPCPDSHEILPLTSDVDEIEEMIDALEGGSATAGQVGIAWGWYALSPNIGMWSGSEVPAAYDAENTTKIVVVMTDGSFNVAYCNGVQSKDYNQISDNINCKATNGGPTAQAKKLCAAMKALGVVIYTVGYNVTSSSTAGKFLTYCASDSAKVYITSGTDALEEAFETITSEVVTLRLSK